MLVGLVNVPLILVALVPVVPPVMPPVTLGADQLYNVPAGTIPSVRLVGVTLKRIPLHEVVVIVVTLATGLIVTVTVKLDPVHTPDNGLTI